MEPGFAFLFEFEIRVVFEVRQFQRGELTPPKRRLNCGTRAEVVEHGNVARSVNATDAG